MADHYHYEDVDYGIRLSVSTYLLEEMLTEYDLQLLITNHITRKISPTSYGSRGVEREQQKKKAVQLVSFEQQSKS